MSQLSLALLILASLTVNIGYSTAQLHYTKYFSETLDEENWTRMLEGEWMIEFFAPWCPACKAFEPVWESLAVDKKNLGINVGKIDVTEAPGLSGRFMVTALPTIYHVKNGVFRQYKSPRDKHSIVQFINDKTWKQMEPVASWKNPTSIQMTIVSQFFKMSHVLRSYHNQLMDDLGLPSWGSYLVFALATIIIGAILGLIIVCVIDFIYPPRDISQYQAKKKKNDDYDEVDSDINEEDLVDNVKDDLIDEEGSESEEKSEGDKTDKETSSPNVRKRKARKAD